MSSESQPLVPVGPYSAAVRAGDFLFCSGQLGAINGELVAGGLERELAQAIANLSAVLGSEGARLSDVVKTTVFLIDMADFETMNSVYRDCFADHRPARSAVAVAALPRGAHVEIEAVAYSPQATR